ncbi:MAG: HD domain-containing protein [Candidatus Omnitrophica bacterium]|jgi:putative nucleotidyltransferase with HDIG domain|nr:HD domain-containing protein [Candidatus Omnitrophota bacterium]
MEKVKQFIMKHFEEIVVVLILLGTIFVNFFVEYKMAFLQLYYLPILITGYILGRRAAVLFAVLSILVVSLCVIFYPKFYLSPASFESSNLNIIFRLSIWGAFLIITAAVVGKLYEEKEKKVMDLHTAYVGVLEILTKYLESADKYTQGHSLRVSLLATDIAISMQLSRNEVENIKVAALLHDIGKIDISLDLIHKASSLSEQEKEIVGTHTEKGAKIVASVGGVLKEAVPLILAHHTYFMDQDKKSEDLKSHKSIPLGARIIAVADSYDAMITDRPYRKGKPPWEAIEQIEKNSGGQFDPAVVEAFKLVMAKQLEKD